MLSDNQHDPGRTVEIRVSQVIAGGETRGSADTSYAAAWRWSHRMDTLVARGSRRRHSNDSALVTERTIMAGQDRRMLFCVKSGIQHHPATPVTTINDFAEDPYWRQRVSAASSRVIRHSGFPEGNRLA
jgi:hypothetical protein